MKQLVNHKESLPWRLLALAGLAFLPLCALAVRAPGPDAFGYTVQATTQFSFLQLTNNTGTNVGTRTLFFDDDTPFTANLGFTFNFYGTSYTNVSFNPNGLMTFGGPSSNWFNVDLTTTSPSNNLPALAVLWDDWYTQESWADGVYYKTIGAPGSRQFVLQWNKIVPVNGDGTNTVIFEARLFEGSNRILFSYLDSVVSDETTLPPDAASLGIGATVGIRDTSGQSNGRNLEWSFNEAVITNGLNLLFSLPDQAPIATSDNVVTAEDTPVTVNVLANDTDPDNDSLTLVTVTQGSNGVVTITATNTLIYSPATNFFGTDQFSYTIGDGLGGSATGLVMVTVSAVNDPPTLNALNNLTIDEDSDPSTINLSGISSGASNENQTLTVTATNDNPDLVSALNISYTSPGTTGTLAIVLVPNGYGTATITVKVNDGVLSNNIVTRSFLLTVNPVNDPPTLDPINDLPLPEDAPSQRVNLHGISSGAYNEGQTLTLTASNSNPALVTNLHANYVSPNVTANILFDLVPDASGTATITAKVNDGASSNNIVTRSFTVTVYPVNDPPTLGALSDLTIDEDAPAQLVSLTGISSGAPNENQTLTLSVSNSNPGLVTNLNLTYTSLATTGSLAFGLVTNASGSAVITVQVDDGDLSNNIVMRSFTVTVYPVNDPPTLEVLTNLTLDEDAPAQLISLIGISSGAPNENQTLTLSVSNSNPGLVTNLNLTYTSPASTSSLAFGLVTNASGSAVITVQVDDGAPSNNIITRSFTVIVNPVNDPPTLNPVTDLILSEGAPPTLVNLSGISSGAPNEIQTLIVTATVDNPTLITNLNVSYTNPSTTGTLTLELVAHATGSAVITATVSDGGSTNNLFSRSFTVTVNPPLRIDSITGLPGGNVLIRFHGMAGKTYHVEGSSELSQWLDLGAATEIAPGEFEFEDTSTAGLEARFYRLTAPAP